MRYPADIVSNRRFVKETIEVDDFVFENCEFVECKIQFNGAGPVKFEGCLFDSCEWSFEGPAEDTLLYLSTLFGTLDSGGQDLVEGIFESVRRGAIEKGVLYSKPAAILHR